VLDTLWATGGRGYETCNRPENFVGFLRHLDTITAADLTLHVVLDNGSSHVARCQRDWLAVPKRVKRFVLHHT
jgi:hypothetical protein